MHIFTDCHYARLFWALSSLSHSTIYSATGDIWEWILNAYVKFPKAEFEVFIRLLWSIWSNRNKVVHEGTGYDPQEAQHFVRRYISRYKEACSQFVHPCLPSSPHADWKPPDVGEIKINFDASVKQRQTFAGLGIVARKSKSFC